ncbi:MAG: PH domain-containing protein [Planctomycetota bacterium]|nr:PH domain-containing protein [Planctomycetota bacterium]
MKRRAADGFSKKLPLLRVGSRGLNMADPQGDTLLVRCKCGNPMRVARQFVGREMTCYACGKAFIVGGSQPQQPAAGGPGADAGNGKAMVPSAPPPQTPPPPPQNPQQPVVYIVQPPAASGAQPNTLIFSPHMTATHNVRVASPIPNPEETIWEGRASLAYFLPGMAWAGLWAVAWVTLAANVSRLAAWVTEHTRTFAPDLGDLVPTSYIAAFFLLCAAIACWGLVKRTLTYLNTYYIFTSQRLRVRQGIVAREMVQMELFRVKDFSLVETLWGRITGYAHVRIVSTDKLANNLLLLGLPGGMETMDKIRVAAQMARAQTGATMIHE